ncbi:MAG: hypothetical protein ABJQ98_05580 [Alloalcanivorax venustensis]|uniref:hypothetical protein n=1 Tax=Pseudomonadota TaxID=1224 RepID=UPI0032991819
MTTLFFVVLYFFISIFIFYKARLMGCSIAAILAIFSRFFLCFAGLFFVLPFSGADAVKFEHVAWMWSQSGFKGILNNFDPSGSYLISAITALFYNLLERNVAIPVFINGILGILAFSYSLILCKSVWGDGPLKSIFPLLVAIHPMLNINSAVVLRENYVILFVVIASIHLARFSRTKSVSSAIFFLFFTLLASFFHGGMILYALGLPLFLLFAGSNVRRPTKIAYGVLFVISFLFIMNSFGLGKVSDIQQGKVDLEYLAELEDNRADANTAYLRGMKPTTVYDVFWQAPVRTIFLLTKPFPWDIKAPGHIIVFLDAMLWFSIIFLVLRNWTKIKENPASLAIILACSVSLVAFAYGTGNFGTGFRHRSKFIILALVVVAPLLPRIRLKEKV